MTGKQTVAEIVTERLIASLEAGNLPPWRKPWRADTSLPFNAHSKRPYRGVNVWLLLCMGYVDPRWVTFRQALDMGGAVRKGEKSVPVVFWKPADKDEAKKPKDERKGPILRFYSVFNVAQCDGLTLPDLGAPAIAPDPIDAAEAIIRQMPLRPETVWTGRQASWSPSLDKIQMPPRELFRSAEAMYATWFHEHVHSTGHEHRVGRKEAAENIHFGSTLYGKEELVAELGAAFLCAEVGIEPAVIDNQAAYLANWVQAIKGDPKMLIAAGGQAQRAVDFILDRKVEYAPEVAA